MEQLVSFVGEGLSSLERCFGGPNEGILGVLPCSIERRKFLDAHTRSEKTSDQKLWGIK